MKQTTLKALKLQWSHHTLKYKVYILESILGEDRWSQIADKLKLEIVDKKKRK
jgi:hypothetical protein